MNTTKADRKRAHLKYQAMSLVGYDRQATGRPWTHFLPRLGALLRVAYSRSERRA